MLHGPYLAPMIVVFNLRITRSIKRYAAAGRVDKAGKTSDLAKKLPQGVQPYNIRPRNIANVNSVPWSASNLSSRGTRAIVLRKAWRKPRWIRGYVFNRYTTRGDHVSKCPSQKAFKSPPSTWHCEIGSYKDILVPKLISLGMRAPHCVIFHADCRSSIQKTMTKSNIMRVSSGSRKRYVRNLDGLN